MIKTFDEFLNEKINWGKIGDKADELTDRFIGLLDYPIIKYIERKVKNLSDEEKLMKIAEISNKIDKIFSPMKNLWFTMSTSFGFVFATFIPKIFFKFSITEKYAYIYLLSFVIYTSLSKKYRLLAKQEYKKIKDVYTDKYLNRDPRHVDPYGEEDWNDNDEIISRANNIRYDKKYKDAEDVPFIGLRHNKDINP